MTDGDGGEIARYEVVESDCSIDGLGKTNICLRLRYFYFPAKAQIFGASGEIGLA